MDEATPAPTAAVYAAHPIYLDEAVSTRITGRRRSHVEKIDQAQALRAVLGGVQVLYAVQFPDGIVKIGCTSDLAARHRHFRGRGGEIIGFTAGDFDDERDLHAILRPHVARGREWYHPTSEVLAVVNEWRDEFGLPHLAA